MGRKIVVSLDESDSSRHAVHWALTNAATPEDHLHLVTVLPPSVYAVAPIAPAAAGASVFAMSQSYEAVRRRDEQEAQEVLQRGVALAVEAHKFPAAHVHPHALPASGGASGVADSVVQFANAAHAAMVVVGSRGMGAVKRSLMSFIGLGSVSDYILHNAACPVMIIRPPSADQQQQAAAALLPPPPPRPLRCVCVAVDDSASAKLALNWAVDHLIRHKLMTRGSSLQQQQQQHEQEQGGGSSSSSDWRLHIVTVAQAVPVPVLDDSSAALVAAAESQAYHQEVAASVEAAKAVAADAAAAAVAAGVDAAHVATAVLPPQGGASDVGLSLVRYAKEHAVDVMVLGNRGLGALRRAALSFVGLGSVTDYCAHNMHCPLAVVKAPPAPAPAAQEQQHGRAAARAHAHSS